MCFFFYACTQQGDDVHLGEFLYLLLFTETHHRKQRKLVTNVLCFYACSQQGGNVPLVEFMHLVFTATRRQCFKMFCFMSLYSKVMLKLWWSLGIYSDPSPMF